MSSVVGGDDSSSSPQLGTGSSADNDESDVKDDKAVKNNSAQAGKSERKKKKKKKKKKRSKKSKSDKKQDPQTNLPAKAEAASAEANGSTGQSAQAKPGDGGLEELLRRSGVGVGGASHHPEGKSVPPSSADSTAPSAHNASTPSATRGAGIAAAALVSSFQRSQSHQQLIKLKDVLRKQFTCALCRDLLYKPVTTPCGHSFCQACLLHMAATGGNLVAAATGAPGSAEAAVRDESSYSGILKDFKCPMCRTELPGCVAQTGVSVALWDAVNAVFKGYAWQRRSEHEAELAHARALPVGAWATYYRQRIGAIVDRIEEGREVHGSFDGHDNSTASGEAATDNLNSNRMNRRVIKEQRDGRVVCQEVRVHPDDRFRRHAVAFVRFPRADILVGKSFSVSVGLLDMDEDEADDEVPLMVAGDDTALLANTRDSVAMALFKLHDYDPSGKKCAPNVVEVDSDGEEITPLYETQRVQQKSMTPTELARAKPTTAPIQEELRDLFDGCASFEDLRPSTAGRYRLVFKSEPSKCITHIDFDVVFPKSKVIDGAAESEDESSDGDRIVRLEDVYSSDDEEEDDDEDDGSEDSFVVPDDEISFESGSDGEEPDAIDGKDGTPDASSTAHKSRSRRKRQQQDGRRKPSSRAERHGKSRSSAVVVIDESESSDEDEDSAKPALKPTKRKTESAGTTDGGGGNASETTPRATTAGARKKRRRIGSEDDSDSSEE